MRQKTGDRVRKVVVDTFSMKLEVKVLLGNSKKEHQGNRGIGETVTKVCSLQLLLLKVVRFIGLYMKAMLYFYAKVTITYMSVSIGSTYFSTKNFNESSNFLHFIDTMQKN